MSPILLGELHASALGGTGQAAIVQKDWDTAEEITSQVTSWNPCLEHALCVR